MTIDSTVNMPDDAHDRIFGLVLFNDILNALEDSFMSRRARCCSYSSQRISQNPGREQ